MVTLDFIAERLECVLAELVALRFALTARQARGGKGGLNAGGIRAREAAIERAEALRPLFGELAGLVSQQDCG